MPELTNSDSEKRIPDEKTELPVLIEAEKALESVLAAALKEKSLLTNKIFY